MAKEYKFMFDRRFDESEEDKTPEVKENLSSKSVDGIPSISQLLDTLNEQLHENTEKEFEENPAADSETETEEDAGQKHIPEQENETPPPAVPAEPALAAAPQPVQPESEPPPPGRFYPFEEIDALKAQSAEEGHLKGIAEGREAAWQEAMNSIEKQNSDTLGLISAQLKELFPVAQQTAETAFSSALGFSMALCRKVLPALAEKHAEEEITALLEKNFHFLKEEPKITIRLNPDVVERMKPHIAEIVKKESYGGKVAVIRDDSLPAGDCRIEWKNGGLERKTEDILNQAEELVKLYGQTAGTSGTSEKKTGDE